MKEHGIIFQGWGVRAIQANIKTQTRRLKGLKEINKDPDRYSFLRIDERDAVFLDRVTGDFVFIKCPYGIVGERLWIRETWACDKYENIDGGGGWRFETKKYKVDINQSLHYQFCWRPSIFMPRWASRLDRLTTRIRAERLLNISEQDAQAEGIEYFKEIDYTKGVTYKKIFLEAWDSINKKSGFGSDINPHVFVYDFKKMR